MSQAITRESLIQITENIYEIAQTFRADMRVPARVFANERILEDILQDRSLWQLINIATLPGIAKYAMAMPDMHEGYGFPIGGVAATLINEGGVISPGGIGYDINCGVRLLGSSMNLQELSPYLDRLATELFNHVPSGVGRGGNIKLTAKQLDSVLRHGAHEMLNMGFGVEADLTNCEEGGAMTGADPALVSKKAKERGWDQLGTLGSGNHFLEIQYVDEIFDAQAAHVFGLSKGQITVMIHCGSRGLGHQTCTDYVRTFMPLLKDYNIQLPDKELVCAPFASTQGQEYYSAMQASANFAWANRHVIADYVRQAWAKVIGASVELNLIYDVSHNMGKHEKHMVNHQLVDVLVHRKGATRAFGPGRPEIPLHYQLVGQPVLIPGTMGTASYVLAGNTEGMEVAFGTSCHGAGRKMSRMKAKRTVRGTTLRDELLAQGIIVRCESDPGLAEEAPCAYKDIDEVVNVVQGAHIARKVVRLKPIAVIKGG